MVNNVPVGIKITSIIYYVFAVLTFLLGIVMFFGIKALAAFPIIGIGFLIVLGIVFIAIAVLEFFVARGLWKAQKWSKVVVIILTILWLIVSILGIILLFSLTGSIIGLVICFFILGNIFFNKKAREFFN